MYISVVSAAVIVLNVNAGKVAVKMATISPVYMIQPVVKPVVKPV